MNRCKEILRAVFLALTYRSVKKQILKTPESYHKPLIFALRAFFYGVLLLWIFGFMSGYAWSLSSQMSMPDWMANILVGKFFVLSLITAFLCLSLLEGIYRKISALFEKAAGAELSGEKADESVSDEKIQQEMDSVGNTLLTALQHLLQAGQAVYGLGLRIGNQTAEKASLKSKEAAEAAAPKAKEFMDRVKTDSEKALEKGKELARDLSVKTQEMMDKAQQKKTPPDSEEKSD